MLLRHALGRQLPCANGVAHLREGARPACLGTRGAIVWIRRRRDAEDETAPPADTDEAKSEPVEEIQTMANYSIDDGNGDQLTTGLSEHDVWTVAQRLANERGESVWVYEDGSDEELTEVEPD